MMSYFRANRFDKEAINDAFEQVAAAIQELDTRNSATSTAANAAELKSIQSQIASIQASIAALSSGRVITHGGTHNKNSTDPTNIEEGQVNGLVADLANKQPIDSTLTAIAALVSAANQLILCTGADTFSIGPLTDAYVAAANKDGIAGTASMRTLGTGAQQACAGNDGRLSDARTPVAHAASHASAGGDPLTLSESQITNLTTDLAAKEVTANKDATGGYAGLTLFKINFKNVLNTFTSFFTNSNTAARTYTFQDRNGTIADDTDLALKAPLASPALTGTPAAPTAADNDSTFQIANDWFVKQQIGYDTGSHGKSQAINMTAAVSGSSGIAVADNANLALGTTTNVTLAWKGSLPVWGNIGTPLYLMHKYQDSANRWGIYVEAATSRLVFYLLGTGGATVVATSTYSFGPPNNSAGEVSVSIVRETISTAGSVTFYWNGIQLGSVIAIPAGTPPSMTNTGTLYVLGTESSGRTAGAVQSTHIYNRALSALDTLDKTRNGVNVADKWGNMTGPVSGCVMALEPEGINATNWTGSANGMNATYPATGSSLVRYASSDIASAMHASRSWFLN